MLKFGGILCGVMLLGGVMAAGPAPEKGGDAISLDPNMAVRPANEEGLRFLSAGEAPLRLSGFPWFESEHVYRRLRQKPETPLPSGVDALAWNTSGGQVAFRSDSNRIVLKVKMRPWRVMTNMSPIGTAGFDLYTGEPGKKMFVRSGRFAAGAREYTTEVYAALAKERKMREFLINFPLYAGVESVYVGVDEGAKVDAPSPWASDRPVVVYGTSITQGGCASRPGMSWTNILSRRLNIPFVNLGFSGKGRGEAEVAREVARVSNPGLFVLDYEANSGTPGLKRIESISITMPEFIKILRAAHPETPILVISKIRYPGEWRDRAADDPARSPEVEAVRKFQEELVAKLRGAGDGNIYYLNGSDFLGEDWYECTVDGVHPTDLGFSRMAEAIGPTIEKILK